MNLDDIYTEVITEHSTSSRNRRRLEKSSITLQGKNPSCGDEIELTLLLKDNKIEDAAFSGVGCAISQASTSMMIDLVKGKSIEEARQLTRLFISMIQKKEENSSALSELDEAIALQNVSKLPARVKCATMPWHTLESALDKESEQQ